MQFHLSILFVCAAALSGCGGQADPGVTRAQSEAPDFAAPTASGDTDNASLASRADSTPFPTPTSKGTLLVESRDLLLSLQTSSCDVGTPVFCEGGNSLTISNRAGRTIDTLKIPTVVVNAENLLFEGPLNSDDFVSEGQTLILSDINLDGVADLAVRTGSDAGYGGASYKIYLFDRKQEKFRLHRKLTRLTEDPYMGMFRAEHGRISVATKSGCCTSEDSLYEIVGDHLNLINQTTTNASTGTGVVTTTSKTLVNGEWKVKKFSK